MKINYRTILDTNCPRTIIKELALKPSNKCLTNYIMKQDKTTMLNYFNTYYPHETNLEQGKFLMFIANPLKYVKYFWNGNEQELTKYLNASTKGGWNKWIKSLP